MVENDRAADAKNNRDRREKLIGIYIGLLAVVLAVCSMGGGNATKDSTRFNIDASDGWSFFQAKNIRRNAAVISLDDLELQLKINPGMPADARVLVEAKIKERKAEVDRLKSDPVGKEGLDQLFAKNRAIEKQRDESMRRDPYFDYGQALLQIAIVIASVALISSGNLLLVVSAICAAMGCLSTFNGFTLLFNLPFIA